MSDSTTRTNGRLALFGGDSFDEMTPVLEKLCSKGPVVVLPTGSAYEHPARLFDRLSSSLSVVGATGEAVMVLQRRDAEDKELADKIREASCVVLAGSSALHLASVLKDSLALDALRAAWHGGATVLGCGAGSTAFSDPMVDPRGGALTVGFGLIRDMAVVTGYTGEITAQLRRTLSLAPDGCPVAALGARSALMRDGDGTWSSFGESEMTLYLAGERVGLEVLAGKGTG